MRFLGHCPHIIGPKERFRKMESRNGVDGVDMKKQKGLTLM